MDVIILGCWNIWNQRNGKIFRREVQSVNCWKLRLKEDLSMLEHKIKSKNLHIYDADLKGL